VKRLMLITMMLAGTLAFWGCTGAIDPNSTPAAIRGEIASLTDNANTYFAEHDLVNTNLVDLAKQSQAYSTQYGDLIKKATDLQNKIKDPSWTDVIGLAQEGMSTLNMLTTALGQNPTTDLTGYAALQKALEGWAQYNDKVGIAAKVAEGAAARSGSTVPPPTATTTPPNQPGKGNHYGWWKNPAWANDPASRGMYPPVPGPDGGDKDKDKGKGKGKDNDNDRDKDKNKDNRDRGNLGLRDY
jgi:hypothetical protein